MRLFLLSPHQCGEGLASEECQHSKPIMERRVQTKDLWDTPGLVSRKIWTNVVVEVQPPPQGQLPLQGQLHQLQGQLQEQHLCKMEAGIAGGNAGKVGIVLPTVDKEMLVAEGVGGETPQNAETQSSITTEDITALH